MMSKHSKGMVQMLLLVDSLVSPSRLQENKKPYKTTDICGPICLELLKKQNLPGSLEKMSEILLASQQAWYSNKCTLTWKAKVTKSNRLLYQLQQSMLPINDTEHGLWLTPSATSIDKRSDAAIKKRQKYRKRIGRTTTNPGNLAEQVQYGFPIKDMMMWRTPDAAAGGGNLPGIKRALDRGHLNRPSGHRIQIRLEDQVREPSL